MRCRRERRPWCRGGDLGGGVERDEGGGNEGGGNGGGGWGGGGGSGGESGNGGVAAAGGGGGVTGRGGLEARVRAYGMPEEGVGGGGREAARSVRARNGSGSGFEPRRREGGQRASVWRVEMTVARRG